VTSHVPSQRWGSQFIEWGYDNMLPGEDYWTPQGAVIYEHGALVIWWLAGKPQQCTCHVGLNIILLVPVGINAECDPHWIWPSCMMQQCLSHLTDNKTDVGNQTREISIDWLWGIHTSSMVEILVTVWISVSLPEVFVCRLYCHGFCSFHWTPVTSDLYISIFSDSS
jgi:hypothetical protein